MQSGCGLLCCSCAEAANGRHRATRQVKNCFRIRTFESIPSKANPAISKPAVPLSGTETTVNVDEEEPTGTVQNSSTSPGCSGTPLTLKTTLTRSSIAISLCHQG